MLVYAAYLTDWNINDTDFTPLINSLALNGDAIAMAEIPSALIGTALVIFFASLTKNLNLKDYLQLNIPAIVSALKWLAIMGIIIFLMEASNYLLERKTPDFMNKVYGSTDNFLLLWLAVIICAPVFEEFLFRGFLFEGLKHSSAGLTGAILISASSWAIIHLQYDWYEIFIIFLIGIVFAIAKLKTQSLYIPILMHMFMNFTASVLMELRTCLEIST